MVLYESNSNLENVNFDDKVSSFIVIGGNWTLFYNIEYCGNGGTFTAGRYSRVAIDDEVSSVRKN